MTRDYAIAFANILCKLSDLKIVYKRRFMYRRRMSEGVGKQFKDTTTIYLNVFKKNIRKTKNPKGTEI